MIFILLIFLLFGFVLKFSYEHYGFIAYRYNILSIKKYTLYQNELLDLVKKDPIEAFQRYREILRLDPLSYNTCHGISHKMGHQAFITFGFDTAVQYQDALCGAGYIHGVIEAKFGLLRSVDLPEELQKVCVVGDGSCYHGIGHGLMVVTKLDIQKSLAYCDQLPELGRRNCYDGVWMHVFDLEETGMPRSGNALTQSDSKTESHFLALCHDADEKYKTSCYFYLPRIFAHTTEINFSSYSSLCALVPDTYRPLCTSGTGHSLMKYHIATPNAPLELCTSFVVDKLVTACKEGGILYYLLSNSFNHGNVPMTESLCDQFTDANERALCKKVDKYRDDL